MGKPGFAVAAAARVDRRGRDHSARYAAPYLLLEPEGLCESNERLWVPI